MVQPSMSVVSVVALTEKGVSPVEVSSGGAEEGGGETGRVRSQGAYF